MWCISRWQSQGTVTSLLSISTWHTELKLSVRALVCVCLFHCQWLTARITCSTLLSALQIVGVREASFLWLLVGFTSKNYGCQNLRIYDTGVHIQWSQIFIPTLAVTGRALSYRYSSQWTRSNKSTVPIGWSTYPYSAYRFSHLNAICTFAIKHVFLSGIKCFFYLFFKANRLHWKTILF